MLKKTRALLHLLILPTLLLPTACMPRESPAWINAQGSGVVVPWRLPGEAAHAAKEAALQEARIRLWNSLLQEKIPRHPQHLTIEQLAVIKPAFKAKVWHLIGNLQAEQVTQDAEGQYTAQVKLDRNDVFRLAEPYLQP